MKILNEQQIEQVSGGDPRFKRRPRRLNKTVKSRGDQAYCAASIAFLGVSPYGGPWAVGGAALNAYGACR